jgi:hypothetical protein
MNGSLRRLKLIFDDNIAADSFRKSWIVVPHDLKLVSDLSLWILQKFQLNTECSNGILLYLDDFALPPTQGTKYFNEGSNVCQKLDSLEKMTHL